MVVFLLIYPIILEGVCIDPQRDSEGVSVNVSVSHEYIITDLICFGKYMCQKNKCPRRLYKFVPVGYTLRSLKDLVFITLIRTFIQKTNTFKITFLIVISISLYHIFVFLTNIDTIHYHSLCYILILILPWFPDTF